MARFDSVSVTLLAPTGTKASFLKNLLQAIYEAGLFRHIKVRDAQYI